MPLDSLKLGAFEPSTNITDALATIVKERAEYNVQAVVLVTDGDYTAGKDPMTGAANLPIPLFTIGVGDSTEQKDILIGAVVANEVALQGTSIPIQAAIHSMGFDNRRHRHANRRQPNRGDSATDSSQRNTRLLRRIFRHPSNTGYS